MGSKLFLAGFILVCSTSVWGGSRPLVSVIHVSSAVAVSSHTWRTVPNAVFHGNEKFSYVVRWGLIKGGTSTLGIQGIEPIHGRPAYRIVSEASSTGIVETFYKTRDRNETWLDVQSLVPLRYEKHIHEGHYRVERVVELDQVHHVYRDHFERLDKLTTDYAEGDVPPDVMDVLGSLYFVRTLPLKVGESYTLDVYDSGKVWPLVVNVQKLEKIKVPAGTFNCVRVEPLLREPGIFVSKGKKLRVWITTDERRMPVLMRSEVAFGHVSAELVDYQLSPQTSRPPL